jgi:hypothetical protein
LDEFAWVIRGDFCLELAFNVKLGAEGGGGAAFYLNDEAAGGGENGRLAPDANGARKVNRCGG